MKRKVRPLDIFPPTPKANLMARTAEGERWGKEVTKGGEERERKKQRC
jgi:hypothetical protein